jgi:hypothetical protein
MPSRSADEVRGIITVVHPERRTQRTVHRILGPSMLAVDAVDSAAEARRQVKQRTPEILVIGAEVLAEADGRALVTEAARGGLLGCIVLAGDAAPAAIPALLDLEPLTQLATHQMPVLAEELMPTVKKLVSGDLFGLEKYLSWGAEARTAVLTDVADRRRVVDALARDVRELGLGPRIASMSSMVSDELLSNALFDAPVDPSGAPTRITDDRHAPRPLTEREQVTMRYASDGRYLALEINDQFGTLDRATIVHHLGKALVRSTDRVELEGPGAGMGIALAYSCCTQLVYNLRPGSRTQAIALLDVRYKPRDLTAPAPAVGIFEQVAG